jgi:fucose permease
MKAASVNLTLVLAYLTYLLFGMSLSGIGTVLGELSKQTSSTLAAIGGVLTFLFLGSLIAQIASGPLTDRLGKKPVLIVSLLMLSAGIIGFTSARSLVWMFLLVLLTGLGQGGVDMGANLVVAEAAPKNNTSALNLLHFFFGLGAFIGPALIAVAIGLTGSGLIVYRCMAAVFFVLALVNAVFLQAPSPRKVDEDAIRPITSPRLNVYLSPLVWLLGVLMLVYVGVEFGLGSWISSYMNITTATTAQEGAWATSAYWAALAIGRLAGALASRKLTPLQLLTAALGGTVLGGIGLFITHATILPTILCLVWVGFAFGTVYPTAVAVAAAAFSTDKGKAVSVLVSMGSIGGLTLPWIAGLLLTGVTSFAYLWFVTLCIACLLILLFFVNRALGRHSYARAT